MEHLFDLVMFTAFAGVTFVVLFGDDNDPHCPA